MIKNFKMAFVGRAEKVLIVTIIFAIFTLLAVTMRLVAKFYFLKSARKEEVVMVFCLVGLAIDAVQKYEANVNNPQCVAFAEIGIVYGRKFIFLL